MSDYKQIAVSQTSFCSNTQRKEVIFARNVIYKMNPSTVQAVQLSDEELKLVPEKYKEGLWMKRRTGEFSKISQATIDRINGITPITNRYINYAIEIFKSKNKPQGDFPSGFFTEMCKSIFEKSLSNTKDPDTIIKELKSIFGVNVSEAIGELLAFYHIYEALVRRSKNPFSGYDKVQHFSYSACKQYLNGPSVTDTAQYIGEIYDLLGGDEISDSKADMYANNTGQAYGASLYKKYHPIRSIIKSNDGVKW